MGKPALVTRRELARASSEGRVGRCDTCGYAVGSCGCNGGARSMATSGYNPPGPGQADDFVANPNGGGGNGGSGWWNKCDCSPGCHPKGFSESRWRKLLRELGMHDKRPPYCDQQADYQEMDTLLSPITTLPVGVLTNIVVQPEGGCFLVAYWRIVVRTAADGLQSVDWTYRKPRITGCPVPCDNLDRDTMAQFAMSVPEACPCGIPTLGYIQRQGEVLPLNIPVTNGAGGELTGQVEVRGYCCDGRICL